MGSIENIQIFLSQSKDLLTIRDNWLPKKSLNEIKHRVKNLSSQRSADNLIRRWKVLHNLPLKQGWH